MVVLCVVVRGSSRRVTIHPRCLLAYIGYCRPSRMLSAHGAGGVQMLEMVLLCVVVLSLQRRNGPGLQAAGAILVELAFTIAVSGAGVPT
jgi:hypothetical protein